MLQQITQQDTPNVAVIVRTFQFTVCVCVCVCVYTTGHSMYKQIQNILQTDHSGTDIITANDYVFTAT
jgi:hypothetical protein